MRPFSPKRQIQTRTDRAGAIKGVHIRIREDGVVGEFSQMLPNLSLGRNLMNQLVRGTGENTRQTERTLTLGRLLIVGKKPHTSKDSNVTTGRFPGHQKT